ncbi:MAG: dockerin type I repeat-containing protein [Candidatus Marinimicrobia bacterium]|nr:dockerin type I repeat-containing protein [Candidatus Neomarinimicrobiota bacterium]
MDQILLYSVLCKKYFPSTHESLRFTFHHTDSCSHKPIGDQENPQVEYEVTATIDDLSEAGLIEESLKVFWKTSSTGYYNSVSLSTTGNVDEYRAFIPSPGENTEIHYYMQAADYSGRVETLPMAGYFAFTVSGLLAGDVTLDGQVNIFDIMAIVHYMLRISELSPEQIDIADMNNDNIVDIFDIASIVDIIISRRS